MIKVTYRFSLSVQFGWNMQRKYCDRIRRMALWAWSSRSSTRKVTSLVSWSTRTKTSRYHTVVRSWNVATNLPRRRNELWCSPLRKMCPVKLQENVKLHWRRTSRIDVAGTTHRASAAAKWRLERRATRTPRRGWPAPCSTESAPLGPGTCPTPVLGPLRTRRRSGELSARRRCRRSCKRADEVCCIVM